MSKFSGFQQLTDVVNSDEELMLCNLYARQFKNARILVTSRQEALGMRLGQNKMANFVLRFENKI